jgi:hypothetical protein
MLAMYSVLMAIRRLLPIRGNCWVYDKEEHEPETTQQATVLGRIVLVSKMIEG